MSARHLDLTDFLAIASAVTGIDEITIARTAAIGLAESALHAPQAAFEDVEFYTDIVEQAAVLAVHLARNHPLPDGNKRVAWASLRYFLMLNDWEWVSRPSVDDAVDAVMHIADGSWGVPELADWLRPRIRAAASE